MTKKGPLSVAEKYYIENNCSGRDDIGRVSELLNRAQRLVLQHFIAHQKDQPFNVASQIPSRNGSTVMTENASSMADDLRASLRPNLPERCVTTIKDAAGE